MGSPSILRIERLNYGLGAVVALASLLTQSKSIALGVCVGVALTCANFFFLRKVVTKMTEDAKKGSSAASMLVLPKMIGLMIAVVLCLAFLPIDGIAFTVGYSIFVVSIAVELVHAVLRPAPAPAGDENNHG